MNQENIKVSQKGLQVKVAVTLLKEDIAAQYRKRLNKISSKTKISGFRKGGNAIKEIERRSGPAVRGEVVESMLQEALSSVIRDNKHHQANMPNLEKADGDGVEKDMVCHFVYEVFPPIENADLAKLKVDVAKPKITKENIAEEVIKLQEHHGEWVDVERKSQDGDQLSIDFAGRLNGELFDGGSATDQTIVLGEGKFLPDFEKNLLKKAAKETVSFDVNFPKDYQSDKLAGQKATFDVVVHAVKQKKELAVGKKLYEATNIEAKTKADFEQKIEERLEQDAAHLVKAINRKRFAKKVVPFFKLKLPESALQKEMDELKGRDETLTDKQAKAQATESMSLALVMRHYMNDLKIRVTEQDLKDYISIAAPVHISPEMFYEWYRQDEKRMEQVQSIVAEQKIFDAMIAQATTKEVLVSISDIEKELKEGV